ncbi:hypothetical protein [Tautonia plasticadhaerens]|uniref:Uncharacterized protein n=1 Tax=Tautonia plasticadhaerens TaxID=2527974 RepID=A0A518GZC8_9BACT|nr:hypothetical protein [Tautonia plasticadhaerens]QDV33956.1 hypothetical protein ElP_18370 [Tautonia plasticadhaerens]
MRAFDINLVRNLIDPYLFRTITKKVYDPSNGVMRDEVRPVIVDDGALPGNDPMMKSSQSDTALLLRGLGGTNTSQDWWYEYGRRIHDRFQNTGPMGIRCDSCTALAFYLLRSNGCSGAITVIEQAKGNATGHWFLLVGCPDDATIQYRDRFPRGCFGVDLWGIGVRRQRGETTSTTSVLDPALCCYSCGDNSLRRKIHREGLTTVPTKGDFYHRTTVPGCIGNKTRSSRLKALDSTLQGYERGTTSVDQLARTFKAWADRKPTLLDGEIDSIRNAEGQMTALRQSIRWLGGAA